MRHPIYDLMKTNIGVDNDSPTEFIARAGNRKSKRSPFKAVYFPKGRGFDCIISCFVGMELESWE